MEIELNIKNINLKTKSSSDYNKKVTKSSDFWGDFKIFNIITTL